MGCAEIIALKACRVLGTYSKPGLKIDLSYCRIAGAASEVLAEVLGRNQGPTKLDRCKTDNVVLTNELRGNNHLKSLALIVSDDFDVGKLQVFAIAGALRENKGLVLTWVFGIGTQSAILSRRIRLSRFCI
jgi:hypothetical protein